MSSSLRKVVDSRRSPSPATLLERDRVESLAALAADIEARRVVGDVVECGVMRGGSAAAMAAQLRSKRRIWLYDSFQGMPDTTEEDGPDARAFVKSCVGSADEARGAVRAAGIDDDSIVLRAGWFADTFAQELPERIALLHIDADWYESVLLCLRTLHDRVVDGGVIVLDDFGYWEGCRRAFYQYVSERNLQPLVERVGSTQLYWQKGRTHRRTS